MMEKTGKCLKTLRGNMNSVKRRLLFTLLPALLLFSVSGTLAWFVGSVKGPGAGVSTGKIDLNFKSYKIAPDGGLEQYVDGHVGGRNAVDSVELLSVLQTSVACLTNADDTDEVYFVVEKNPGSIPLDVQLSFEPEGLFAEAAGAGQLYAGGFWYDLQDITGLLPEGTGLPAVRVLQENGSFSPRQNVSEAEKRIAAYGEAGVPGIPLNRRTNLLRIGETGKQNSSSALRDGDFCVFRLTVGLDRNAAQAVQYLNRSFSLKVELTAAQEGGLEMPYGDAETYYVSDAEELLHCMTVYKPGDSLCLSSDVTVYGDLVFPRPVNLYMSDGSIGRTLTVYGNLIFTYPYEDSYSLNTGSGGRLVVRSYNNAGGNLTIDTPYCYVSLNGSNNAAPGRGDIYVTGDFSVNASCLPDADVMNENLQLGYGLNVNKTVIREGTGAAGENQVYKRIYLYDGTMLTVGKNTTVGQVFAGSGAADSGMFQVVILNYGTMSQAVDLSLMALDARESYNKGRHIPQIYIDNYGTLGSALSLPSWSRMFNRATLEGNTRIIREVGAADEGALGYADAADIITVLLEDTVRVVDIDGDGTDLRVYYTWHEETQKNDTLSDILQEYLTAYAENGTVNRHTADLTKVRKMAVIGSRGKQLTADDYAALRSLTGLTELDLSRCETAGIDGTFRIPDNAFKNMTGLEKLELPGNAVTAGNSLIAGTSVRDISLPASLKTVTASSFSAARYVHVGNEASAVANFDLRTQYLFVPESLLAAYRAAYGAYPDRIFKEAVWNGGDWFYRIVSANTLQIAAYVGLPCSDDSSQLRNFNFRTVEVGDRDYTIVGFDDYAFYGKLEQSGAAASDAFPLVFSDRLASVGKYAFWNGTAIRSLSFSSDCGCTVGDCGFYGCSAMEWAELEGVRKIGDSCFSGCTSLIRVESDTLQSFGKSAFENCRDLVLARLPQAVSDGGDGCFKGTQDLMVLELAFQEKKKASDCCPRLENNGKMLYIVHTENSADAEVQPGWYNHNTNGLSGACRILIGGGSFCGRVSAGSKALKINTGSITADSYVYRNDAADYGDLQNTVSVFAGTAGGSLCGMERLGYGDYVFGLDRENGEAVLLYCSLSSIAGTYTVPDSLREGDAEYPVTAIGEYAFCDVDFAAGTTVVIPANIADVGRYAFRGRNGITEINACGGGSIGEYAFSDCDDLKSFRFDGGGFVGTGAFYDCDALREVHLPEIREIYAQAFQSCDDLLLIRMPKLQAVQGNSAKFFEGCAKLTVLDSGFVTGVTAGSAANYCSDNCLASCAGLKYVIFHTEGRACDSFVANYVSYLRSGARILVDGLPAGQGNSTHAAFFAESKIANTGSFTADMYVYADGPEDAACTVTRTARNAGGTSYSLSDIGCGDYVLGLADGKLTILYCALESVGGTYTVPAEFSIGQETYPVAAIGSSAFRDVRFEAGTKLVIPDGIASVGSHAFYGKAGLEEVTACGSGSVGAYAFYDCDDLRLCRMYGSGAIDDYAFYDCDSLREFLAPNARELHSQAFSNCDNLLKLYMPQIELLQANAYLIRNCPKLMVLDIGFATGYTADSTSSKCSDYCLQSCSALNYLILHTENRTCDTSTTFLTYLSSSSAGARAIVDGNPVTAGNKSHAEIAGTTKIVNTGSLTADRYCYADAPADAGEGTARQSRYADGRDWFLSDIGYGDYVLGLSGGELTILYCALESVSGTYTVPDAFRIGENTYPVTAIGGSAYRDVRFAPGTKLVIPESIGTVGGYAFYEKAGLEEVEAYGGGSIGAYAFCNCDDLKLFSFAGSGAIDDYAFYDCDGLREFSAPNVTELHNQAFNDCGNLLKVCLPGLRSVQGDATHFRSCPKLTVLDIGYATGYTADSATLRCSDYSLQGCSALNYVILHTEGRTCDAFASLYRYVTYYCSSAGVLTDGLRTGSGDKTHADLVETVKVFDTGSYTADQYIFADALEDAGTSVARQFTYADGRDWYLSDLGYGDYVIVKNGDLDGKGVTVLYCALRSVSATYTVPEQLITPEGEIFTVTAIGPKAYRDVNWNAANLTVPTGIASIGNGAFWDCGTLSRIDLLRHDSPVGAENICGNRTNYSGLTIYLAPYAYDYIYTGESWGGIPRSCFRRAAARCQVDNGAVFDLDVYGDGWSVTYVTGSTGGTLTLPESCGDKPVLKIGAQAFSGLEGNTAIHTLALSANLQEIAADAGILLPSLSAFTVPEENAVFSAKNGVLYSRDGSILVKYPAGKADTLFRLEESTEGIATGAFENVGALEILVIPARTRVVLSDGAFRNCGTLAELRFMDPEPSRFLGSGTFENCAENLTILVPEGSESAYRYSMPGDPDSRVNLRTFIPGHAAVKCEAAAASCTENGSIECWYCGDCGRYFADEEGTRELTEHERVIPAAHRYAGTPEWFYLSGGTACVAGFRCTAEGCGYEVFVPCTMEGEGSFSCEFEGVSYRDAEPEVWELAQAQPDRAAAPQTETEARPETEMPQAEAPQSEGQQEADPKAEEPQTENPQTEGPQEADPKAEESQTEDPQEDDLKAEEPQTEDPQEADPKAEEPQTEVPQEDDLKTEVPQTEAPRTEAAENGTAEPEGSAGDAPAASDAA